MTIEVCASSTTVKVGKEDVFTVKASDPDGPVGELHAAFGDDADAPTAGGTCIDTTDARSGRSDELAREFRHTYAKPGTYTAVFTNLRECAGGWSPGKAVIEVTVTE